MNRRKQNENTEKLTKINTFNRKSNVRLEKTLRELLLPYKNQRKAMQNQRNLHKTKENHCKTTIFREISKTNIVKPKKSTPRALRTKKG